VGQRGTGTRLAAIAVAAVVAVAGALLAPPPGSASPGEEYTRPHFGNDLPPGCKGDSMLVGVMSNVCHHMRADMNGLDSPIVDVLIMVPVSPAAERDARIMRQAVEMWEGGIDYLAPQMGLDWLGSGTDFRITVDTIDPTSDRFSLFPVVDPEIVVIATNPIGAAGIGVDPLGHFGPAASGIVHELTGVNPGLRETPCSGYSEVLFDMAFWDALPGFDSHHEGRSGTYTEDCGGAGGNVCFAVNTATDPAPDQVEIGSLFDLVAHEFGHCMTIGHVGDGAEGSWGTVPPNDIMAYNDAPVGLTKCVSTLDLESVATSMSKYLDVNGDGLINGRDRLLANDPPGDGLSPFQTQHPRDHFYASSTGQPRDCPQPSLGLVPGPRTDWTPDPATTVQHVLTVTSPAAGARANDTSFKVAGTVEKVITRPYKSPATTSPSSPTTAPTAPQSEPDNGAKVRATVNPSPTPQNVTFTHEDGNTFHPQDTTLGADSEAMHLFGLELLAPGDVTFTLDWGDALELSDLDLYVTGAATSGSEAASAAHPEQVTLRDVRGHLNIAVDPYLVTDPVDGITYTLTAVVTGQLPQTDRDGDETPDGVDVCVDRAGSGADGCPIAATERVLVYVDEATAPVATEDVDTTNGRDSFAVVAPVPRGTHTLRIVWAATSGKVFATKTVTVTRAD
jgi:hypothetical protein